MERYGAQGLLHRPERRHRRLVPQRCCRCYDPDFGNRGWKADGGRLRRCVDDVVRDRISTGILPRISFARLNF